MAVREIDTLSRVRRPPRAMAWVLLLTSASAVLFVGLLATILVFGALGSWAAPPLQFWPRLLAACLLTILSISLRSLRWIFLLRRAETRIPIRDAYIGYLAGLSLVFTPLLLGEMTVRAFINRVRGHVPIAVTMVVNLWERLLDFTALVGIAALTTLATGRGSTWASVSLAAVLATLFPPVRRVALATMIALVTPPAGVFEKSRPLLLGRLAATRTWVVGLSVSLAAWVLPGAGLWILVGGWGSRFSLAAAEQTYASSTAVSGAALAPGGVLIAGSQMLANLVTHGIPDSAAALTVLGIRLATVGLSIVLGVAFVAIHFRSAKASGGAAHFDEIADAYDVQIPESRRHALLDTKTSLMREILDRRGIGRRGLDVGCGQGAYVARMRTLGFDVSGIDASAGQVGRAALHVGQAHLVAVGSVLDIPAPDASFDFLYIINVLHHLESIADQERAFDELLRVLKPGGLLFVHEINTRNVVFRFYMGYVFPSLNCIDEGVERWLLPHRLAEYTRARVVEVRHFTFLPDFVPRSIAGLLKPLERLLEASPLRVYSAHYMAVLEKEARPDR